jgi:hypothetical protein
LTKAEMFTLTKAEMFTLTKAEMFTLTKAEMFTLTESGNAKLVFKDIYRLYNGDRIFCLDEDMSIIVFEK